MKDEKGNEIIDNYAKTILDAGKLIGSGIKASATVVGFDGEVPAAIIPQDWKIQTYPETMPAPLRKTGMVKLDNADSFIRFYNDHKESNSVIFVDADTTGQRGAVFTGIINYHGLNEDEPQFGDFRCVYAAQLSPDWKKWLDKSKSAMNHAQFLEHLDDCQDMIVEPEGAKLLELMRDLEGTVGGAFKSAINLHNGSMDIRYSEEVKANDPRDASVQVPVELVVSIQPFDFGAAYRMKNKLRYRVANRAISFGYEPVKPELIILDAVNDQVKNIEKNCGLTPFYGKPPEICKAF